MKKADKLISHSKIAITASSCITAYGRGIAPLWQACVGGESRFENGLAFISDRITKECRSELAGTLKPELFSGSADNKLLNWTLACIRETLADMNPIEFDDRLGMIVATTTGLTEVWESELMNFFRSENPKGHVYQPLGTFAQELKNQMGFLGPTQIVSSACAAGTQAIALGKNWIQSGLVDRVLVIGAEQICRLTDTGFRSLSLVDGNNCRPFNESFSGICLSEAVGVLLLENDDLNRHPWIAGTGSASDAHSMTAPKPDGSGPRQAIIEALKEANLERSEIDWVHAHGTGSLHNDRAEAAAVKTLEIECEVTSTKGVHGHSLAASGVLETILCIEALKKQEILPTTGCDAGHFNINISTEHKKKCLDFVLKNTLGFGGINSCLIIGRGNQ